MKIPPRSPKPYVTWAAAAASVLIFVARLTDADPWSWEALERWGVVSNYEIYEGAWWSLLASTFVHGDFMHVGFNVYWLWVLGSVAERTIGTVRYAAFFAAAAFVSAAAELAFTGDCGIGLSGVGYAIAGFMWFGRARYRPFRTTMTPGIIKLFVGWAAVCILATKAGIWNIANYAHIGGFAFGSIVGFVALPRTRVVATLGAASLLIAAVLSVQFAVWSPIWHITRADAASDADDLETARSHLTDAIRLDPTSHYAHEQRGWIHTKLDEYEAAAADLTNAIELEPGDPYAWALRGYCYRTLERYDEAVSDLTTAETLGYLKEWAAYERGQARNETKEFAGAITDYTRAIGLDPEFGPYYEGRGFARRNGGDASGALEDLKRALELDPDSAFALRELGWIRFDQQQYRVAIRTLNKALALDASDGFAMALRGLAKDAWGETVEALRDLNAAVELAPDEPWILIQLCTVLFEHGQDAEAADALERAIERGHADADVYNHLAWIRMGAEDLALMNRSAAIDYARRATSLEPDNPNHWSALSCALFTAGDWNASLEALDRSLTLGGDVEQYAWLVGALEAWPSEDDTEESLQYIHDVVELVARKGQFEQVRKTIDEAAALAGLSGR